MESLRRSPDSQKESSSSMVPDDSHGKRQERKLLLLFGLAFVIGLGFALFELSPRNRALLLLYYLIVAGALLLMARFIVYSYKRERGRLNPYDRDHIVK